jgi:hypothetical protein
MGAPIYKYSVSICVCFFQDIYRVSSLYQFKNPNKYLFSRLYSMLFYPNKCCCSVSTQNILIFNLSLTTNKGNKVSPHYFRPFWIAHDFRSKFRPMPPPKWITRVVSSADPSLVDRFPYSVGLLHGAAWPTGPTTVDIVTPLCADRLGPLLGPTFYSRTRGGLARNSSSSASLGFSTLALIYTPI